MVDYPETSERGQERRYDGQDDVIQRGTAKRNEGVEGSSHRNQTISTDEKEEHLFQLRLFYTIAAIERYKGSNQ